MSFQKTLVFILLITFSVSNFALAGKCGPKRPRPDEDNGSELERKRHDNHDDGEIAPMCLEDDVETDPSPIQAPIESLTLGTVVCGPIGWLQRDLMRLIFKMLDHQDLVSVTSVCRAFRKEAYEVDRQRWYQKISEADEECRIDLWISAAEVGNVEALTRLLDLDRELPLVIRIPDKRPALHLAADGLHMAAIEGKDEAFRELLQADPDGLGENNHEIPKD
ncbi:MAG: F-box protein [Bdellovibrio sp.]|nr:F-box protein [Bdellovibrio sp.]